MKAIVRVFPGGTGDQSRATYDRLQYVFKPKKKPTDQGDRVGWIDGDLDGYGMVDRKAQLMATALDCGHEHLKGRRTRHLIVSCEPCGEENRADAEERLKKSAPLLAAELGARRWIAVIHRDSSKPHMHLILANFDEEKERRFDFRPDFMSKIQDMKWTPHLEKGKGTKT